METQNKGKLVLRFLGLTIPLASSLFVSYYLIRFFINPSLRVVIYETNRIIAGAEILTLLFGIIYLAYLIWKLV
jgi:hypothetical protein